MSREMWRFVRRLRHGAGIVAAKAGYLFYEPIALSRNCLDVQRTPAGIA
jgi:hypothetical protein